MARNRPNAGFTLVETLAGFTILALSMVLLMGGVTTAFRRDVNSQKREDLLRLARGGLDAVGVRELIAAGTQSGTFDDRYRWTLTAVPYRQTGAPSQPDSAAAFWVEIVVEPISPAERTSVRLRTVKLQRGAI